MEIVDIRLFRVHGYHLRLICQEAIDLSRQQRCDAIGIAVEQQVFAVRKELLRGVLHDRAYDNAELFSIVILPTNPFGRLHGFRAIVLEDYIGGFRGGHAPKQERQKPKQRNEAF